MNAAEQDLKKLQGDLAVIRMQVLSELSESAIFQELPAGVATATTDAEGKFTLKLARNSKYAIVATGKRRVFDSTEEYYWMIWAGLDGKDSKQIMLTNQNLFDQGSDQNIFKLSDLVPKSDDLNSL